MSLESDIKAFKKDLKGKAPLEMVRKHITYGPSRILTESQYFDLKEVIADYYHLHPSQVMIVGSGKLGFSIVDKPHKSKKRYRPFDDDSDLDIAIVSQELFDKIWKEVYLFNRKGSFWKNKKKFMSYLFEGWIRPDKLPPDEDFEIASKWWDFFQMLTNSGDFGPYQVRAGLYKDWEYLESYHIKAIEKCKTI